MSVTELRILLQGFSEVVKTERVEYIYLRLPLAIETTVVVNALVFFLAAATYPFFLSLI